MSSHHLFATARDSLESGVGAKVACGVARRERRIGRGWNGCCSASVVVASMLRQTLWITRRTGGERREFRFPLWYPDKLTPALCKALPFEQLHSSRSTLSAVAFYPAAKHYSVPFAFSKRANALQCFGLFPPLFSSKTLCRAADNRLLEACFSCGKRVCSVSPVDVSCRSLGS